MSHWHLAKLYIFVLMFDEEWMAKKMCDWTQGT
jgi:hypothetical protein